MEIALVNNSSIRIKGKQGSLIVNPSAKATEANGFIALADAVIDKSKLSEGTVVIRGPGEYEFGGIKVSGVPIGSETAFSIRVDRVDILLGRTHVLEKEYSKLTEHHIVLLYNTETADPSFVTSLAINVVIFYGDKANENLQQFAKDSFITETRYSTSLEKLPPEVEKVLLA